MKAHAVRKQARLDAQAAAGIGKLEWSAELGRMVIRRDDGGIWDVGFGQFANEGKARLAEWSEKERGGGW